MEKIEEYNARIYTFKNRWCDENDIIPRILKDTLSNYLIAPILDVGAGLGDIAFHAFADKKAICLDLVVPRDLLAKNHTWLKTDFFDFLPNEPIRTILISHSQQFLDEDIARFRQKIYDINPEYIILVSNLNDGILGEIVNWTLKRFPESNPEVKIEGFPLGYSLAKKIAFAAHLTCDAFTTLSEQISYLMLNDSDSFKHEVRLFLEELLEEPKFEINEIIEVYEKNS